MQDPKSGSAFFFRNRMIRKGFCMKRKILILLSFMLCLMFFSSCGGNDLEEIEWQSLTWGVGAALPEASEFAVDLPQGITVSYAKEYSFSKTGMYQLDLIARDADGKELQVTVGFHLVIDSEKPTITGIGDLVTYVGEGISYKNCVSVRDNCGGKVVLEVDSTAVDLRKAGEYPVIYRATDAAGNVNTVTVTLYVYEERVTEAELYQLLDPIISQKISVGASKEQQVREVYFYVHNQIEYVSSSDKNGWVRAAYDGLRTGKGDCYTYYALSKAFFERLGIQNMGIQRTVGIVDERHYWNYVNIGTESAPRWYHYDATRIRGATHDGYLLTNAQLMTIHASRVDENGVGYYFYAYDATQYPEADTVVVNHTLG